MKKIILPALTVLVLAGTGVAAAHASHEETCTTVVVTPATPGSPAVTAEVFDHWQRYSWTGGPHTSDSPPAFPSADWQPNVKGDPHGIGVEGAYFRSHGNSGRGDWFYLEAVTTTVEVTPAVPPTPEVTEQVCTPVPHEEPTLPVPPGTPSPTEEATPVTPSEAPVPSEEPTTEAPVPPAPEEDVDVPEEDDPVVTTVTKHTPHKTVKIHTHQSGDVTRQVTHYPTTAVEEGL